MRNKVNKRSKPLVKPTTIADFTSTNATVWKVVSTMILKRFRHLKLGRATVTTITKDCYTPTRLKKWILETIKVGNKTIIRRRKVDAGEGVLNSFTKGDIYCITPEVTSVRSRTRVDD